MSCVVGVWLGRISIVPATVRESATPDSKENKEADASSENIHQQSVNVTSTVSTHIQQECLAEPLMHSILCH